MPPRPGRCAAVIRIHRPGDFRDKGERFGHVVCRGTTFTASRKSGTPADIRMFAQGFRSLDAAVAWVEAGASELI